MGGEGEGERVKGTNFLNLTYFFAKIYFVNQKFTFWTIICIFSEIQKINLRYHGVTFSLFWENQNFVYNSRNYIWIFSTFLYLNHNGILAIIL